MFIYLINNIFIGYKWKYRYVINITEFHFDRLNIVMFMIMTNVKVQIVESSIRKLAKHSKEHFS